MWSHGRAALVRDGRSHRVGRSFMYPSSIVHVHQLCNCCCKWARCNMTMDNMSSGPIVNRSSGHNAFGEQVCPLSQIVMCRDYSVRLAGCEISPVMSPWRSSPFSLPIPVLPSVLVKSMSIPAYPGPGPCEIGEHPCISRPRCSQLAASARYNQSR